MNYEFNKSWWLKWYWSFIEPIYLKELHYGTRQSAKSHNIARKLIYHSFAQKQFNVIHSRKVYGDIEGSTFKLLTDLIYTHFPNDFIVRKSHFEIINRHTGNWFRGLGMDKAEKGKGVEGANIAWLNEANQFTREDADYIDTTLRGNIGVPISMIMDWNPESINHWLKAETEAFENKPNCLVHKSTFWDNYTIDRNALHDRLLRIKEQGPEGERRYKVWALGDWGVEDIDSSFFYSFDQDIHVINGRIKVNPNYPLYLSFDFNITSTCGVQQMSKNALGEKYIATINRIKTYRMPLEAILESIKSEFPNMTYIINGDASGGAGNAFTKDNISGYQIIQKALGLKDYQMQIPPGNPSHISSRIVSNLVMQKANVQIGKTGNEALIVDFKEAQVNREGSLDPWKNKNPNKGHSLDEWRYFLWSNFNEISRMIDL